MKDIPGDTEQTVDTLRERLASYNHWWRGDIEPNYDLPGVFDPTSGYRSLRGDYFYVLGNVLSGDESVVGLSGPPGVGKSTLLHQLVRLFVDDGLQKELGALAGGDMEPAGQKAVSHTAWAIQKYHPELTERASELTSDQVCYLPLDSDATNQIQAGQQIAAAVERYESEILDGEPNQVEHVLLIDDIHAVASQTGSDGSGWGTIIKQLLTDRPTRTLLVTAVADLQIDRELTELRVNGRPLSYTVEEITPPKFSDYAQRRYPIYEGDDGEEPDVNLSYVETTDSESQDDPDQYRLRSSPLHGGLIESVLDEDAAVLWSRLEEARFSEEAVFYDESRLRQCFREYLLLGGMGSLQIPDDVMAVRDPKGFAAELADHAWQESAADCRMLLRTALHREATTFKAIKNVRNLERLFAWTANNRPVEPVAYRDIHGQKGDSTPLFEVDRRTLREKYFDPLSRMDILTPSEEYGNQRPTAVRPAPRDPGLINAVAGRRVVELLWNGVSNDPTGNNGHESEATLETIHAELAYLTAFDHIVRLSYLLNEDYDPKQGVVKYWESSGGTLIDFIPRFRGAPVPVAVAYPEDELTLSRKRAALFEFLERQTYADTDRFDPPVSKQEQPVEAIEDLVHLKGVGQNTIDAMYGQGYQTLEALSNATETDLTEIPGIGRAKAQSILSTIDVEDSAGAFQRRLSRLQEHVSGDDYMGELEERTFAEDSDTGRTTKHYHVVDGPAPFGMLLTGGTRQLLAPAENDAAIVELPLWEFLAAT